MSEHEEQRPLSRREIRLRQMAAAAQQQDEAAAVSPEDTPRETGQPVVNDDIEISLYNEDGTPRTRRQMRELREQALAERAAAAAALDTAEPEEAPPADDLSAEAETPAVDDGGSQSGDDSDQEESSSPADTADPQVEVPTQPFTIEDLREAEQRGQGEAEDEHVDEASAETEPAGSGDALVRDPADAEEVPDTVVLDALPEDIEHTDDRPLDVAEEDAAVDEILTSEDDSVSDTSEERDAEGDESGGGYSFPNIEPPEEWRSVFDDPSTRVVPDAPQTGSPTGSQDFDEIISRAVVQEGSTGGTGNSALILPSMPDDAGLSGPLGGTGELFVTGSIEVPKSIGETGGHASLHDSVEVDPLDDLGDSQPTLDPRDSGPVSARSAVSAMSQTGVPGVSDVKKDRSKLPLILSLTGGGLVVVVGALVIWGAASGVFG